MRRIKFCISVLYSILVFPTFFIRKVNAQEGSAIEIGNLGQLLWDIVATIQFYSLPIMAISIAGLGAAMIFSGDDSMRKENLKGWIVKIFIGGVLVFSATTIAQIVKNSVSTVG